MQSLFVIEQGARLAKRGERIVVLVGDIIMEQVRVEDIDRCVVMGNVSLTPPAVKALLKMGTDVVFMTKGGGFVGRLSGGLSRNILLRQKQFRAMEDDHLKLLLAKSCVMGKIENQRRLLAKYQKRRTKDSIAKALVALRHSKEQIFKAKDLNQLRGVEGQAAAQYFSCWKDLIIANDISFVKRMRRPPPDPVNILLSMGYTQLGNALHSMVESSGLDPYMGALHAPCYGRPSLVLDIIEEFRPVIIDTAVLRSLNNNVLSKKDFQFISGTTTLAEEKLLVEEYEDTGEPKKEVAQSLMEKPPVVFLKSGIKKWVTQYQRRLDEKVFYEPRKQQMTLLEIVRAQVYHFARCIENQSQYEPFIMPR